MNVSLIQVPYHLGHEQTEVGRGPELFVEAGLTGRLTDRGHEVAVDRITRQTPFTHEIGATMDVNAALADRVQETVNNEHFPLILAENCNSCLGTLAGLKSAASAGESSPGIVWFDAHGDINTPETTPTGFFDGMPLAIATGECWTALTDQLPEFSPVPEAKTLLAGVRDLDTQEAERLTHSEITLLDAARLTPVETDVESVLASPLAALENQTREVYVHLDLDVLDASIAPANELAPPGGLSVGRLEDMLQAVTERFKVRAAALTSYNPACDPDDRALEAGLQLITTLGDHLEETPAT
jgi:arginase